MRTTIKSGRAFRGGNLGESMGRAAASNVRPKRAAKPVIVRAPVLKSLLWLAHGFSTRPGGASTCYGGHTLNLGFTEDDSRDCVLENRRRFLIAAGAAGAGRPWPLIAPRQIHSDIIHTVDVEAPGPLIGDGLITGRRGIAIAIQTADCLPVLLADERRRVAGVFHAGWRGTVQRIVEKGVGVMRQQFGSRPEDIFAAVGPGIRKCCYGVGEEVREAFETQFTYAAELFHGVHDPDTIREKYPLLFLSGRPPGHGDAGMKLHLDLGEANRRQLLAAGVRAAHIDVIDRCASCESAMFFSHRKERGRTGRMMLVAGIAP